jgi:hypothetical protein
VDGVNLERNESVSRGRVPIGAGRNRYLPFFVLYMISRVADLYSFVTDPNPDPDSIRIQGV